MEISKRLLFCLFLLSLVSCSKMDLCDCFKSTGTVITEDRNPGWFHEVNLQDNVNLYISRDSICHVRVRAGKNLLGSINTDVSSGVLSITNGNSCNWVRDLNNQVDVYVSLPSFDNLIYKGYGNVRSLDTIAVPELGIYVHDGSGSIDLTINNVTTWINSEEGAVDFVIRGKSGVNYIYNNGLGPVDCRGLHTDYTFITNQSTNDCFVNARKELDAKIEYMGNIYYVDKPDSLVTTINGEGNVIWLGK